MHGCDAASYVAIADACETGFADHLRKQFLAREFANALDQILVGFAITRRQLPKARDDFKGMKIIEPVEDRDLAFREFQAQKPPARLQDSVSLAQGLIDTRDIANAKRDCVGVE